MNTSTISSLRAIRPEDIPTEYQDIVEVLSLPVFLDLVSLCGGQDLYLPKLDSLERRGRDREIRARFDGGNYRALARQFRLSERHVRKIIDHPSCDKRFT